MPKKMARLDESPDYRPFKFRIQAFTNAFHDEVSRYGIVGSELVNDHNRSCNRAGSPRRPCR